MLAVPVIDLPLQLIALFQQCLIDRQQIAYQPGKAVPKGVCGETSSRQNFFVDEIVQQGRDTEGTDLDSRRGGLINGLPGEGFERRTHHTATTASERCGIICLVKLTR